MFIRDDSHSTVRMLYPDGSTELWSVNLGFPENPRPSTYTPDGRMFGYITQDGRMTGYIGPSTLVEILPSGTSREIAGGFQNLDYVAAMPDGALITTEFLTQNGRVSRIEPDGTVRTLFTGLGDSTNFMKVSPDGKLYVLGNLPGFVEMDPLTGAILREYEIGDVDPGCVGMYGFSFVDEAHVAFANNRIGSVSVYNLAGSTIEHLAGGMPVNVYLEPRLDDDVYALTSFCSGSGGASLQVVSINRDGEVSTVRELPGNPDGYALQDFTMDAAGGIYTVGIGSSALMYFPPGDETGVGIKLPAVFDRPRPISIAWDPVTEHLYVSQDENNNVYEYMGEGTYQAHRFDTVEPLAYVRIAFGQDGTLYAVGSGAEGARNGPTTTLYVMRMDRESQAAEVLFSWGHRGSSGRANDLAVDSEGGVWVHTNGDVGGVIRVAPDGTHRVVANSSGYGIDANGLAVNPNGDVFIGGPMGIFRMYQPSIDP